MLKSLFLSVKLQISFKSVVFSFHLLLLKEHLCQVYLLINIRPGEPTYWLLFSDVITVALQITFVSEQFPSTMHLSLQLHCFYSSTLSSNILQFSEIIWLFMFSMQEYKIFNSFLLKILWYRCIRPKFQFNSNQELFTNFYFYWVHEIQDIIPFPFGFFIVSSIIDLMIINKLMICSV